MNLKVRAFDKIDKKYKKVEALSFHHLEGTVDMVKIASEDLNEPGEWYAVARFVLEHGTGRRDVDGAEIFSGDLIHVSNSQGEVTGIVFIYYATALVQGDRRDDYHLSTFFSPAFSNGAVVKTIGNVNENPELLKGEK